MFGGWRWRLILALAVLAVSLYGTRASVLIAVARLLVSDSASVESDVVVILRSDRSEYEYDRTNTASRLFNAGMVKWIYVSDALADESSWRLRQRDIIIPSPQQNIVSMLLQQNVPCERIILDSTSPGGGTVGEMRRVREFMLARRFSSALIVTSWFHARRAARIMNRVIAKSGRTTTLIIADSAVGPEHWWRYRYTAIAVLEEYVKLGLDLLPAAPAFSDDPIEQTPPVLQAPTGCDAASAGR